MNKIIEQAYDPEIFRKQGKELVDLLADYLKEAYSGNAMPILPNRDPEAQYALQKEVLNSGSSFQSFVRDVIRDSNHLHHPRYIGHQVSAPLPLTALFEFIGSLMNNASAIYEMGPVSVAMERVVMKEMAKLLNFEEEAEGFFTSGGTLGNLTALLAARQAKAPFDVWKEGMDSTHKLAFMVPADAHYSVARSLRIMGFGDEGIIPIPASDDFITRTDLLETIYEKALSEGKKVIGLSANACSTATGIYDHLREMGDFCAKHQLWFHVDGAHGAPAMFSKKHKYRLEGINRADSVVIDFHKMMNSPALLTLVLFRNPAHSRETFSQNASYLFEKADSREWYNLSKRTMECTKRSMGLTVFSLWKFHGPSFFEEFIDSTYALASQFAALVEEQSDFELAAKPQSNIVCFRLVKEGMNPLELDELNKKIRKALIDEGSFYIVQTALSGSIWLRVTIMNPFTQLTDLESLVKRIRELGL